VVGLAHRERDGGSQQQHPDGDDDPAMLRYRGIEPQT